MNVVMPREPFVGSVFAYTSKVEASGPLVILEAQEESEHDLLLPQSTAAHQNLFPFST